MELTGEDARAIRMASLLLTDAADRPTDVLGVVEWFGAMQSQDLASGLWSFGARLRSYTLADVQKELETRTVLRTWPMRGTIHFVPSSDARWMLALTGLRPFGAVESRWTQLGLDDATVKKAHDLLGGALAGGRRLTRAQALAVLSEAGIDTTAQRGYHMLVSASVHGITCIAPHVGKEQTFVLLDDWAATSNEPSHDEALAILAGRYFASHGPATEKDFAGWSGLTLTDARRGIAAHDLARVRVDGIDMLMPHSALESVMQPDDIVVLPGFDEYLLGYKDRSLVATPNELKAIVPGNNGVFQSTIVHRGRVIGIWKRTTGKRSTVVTATTFGRAPRTRVEAAFQPYARYLGHPVDIRWN